MIKVEILFGENRGEEGVIAGFVVKENTDTYAIVSVDGKLIEYDLDDLKVIN